jgi:acetyl esterase/lipase
MSLDLCIVSHNSCKLLIMQVTSPPASPGHRENQPVSTLPLVRPDLLKWLEAMPSETWDAGIVPLRRAQMLEMARSGKPPLRADLCEESRYVPGPTGAPEVRVLIVRPRERADVAPAILHMHDGGFVAGLPEYSRATLAGFAGELGAVVVSVDYRLAPETRFPGALEDCYAALAWLVAHAAALGIDPARIAVSGESAGGGLAAGLSLLARDRGEYRIAFQHLVFPGLDDRTALRKDLSPLVGEFIWTNASNHFAWSALLGEPPGGPDVSPYAAPARAADLSGLPPACIAVGALDLFVEENVDYARRLIAAGVPCELHVYAGAPHGFPMAWRSAVAQACTRDSHAALRRALL